MKRYIFILSVILAVFTSCTNDDITISYTTKGYTTNFKIDPSTVIAPFTYEHDPGELEGIPSSYRLRMRLLIYDASGTLMADDEQLFTSYAIVMASSKSLPKGNYIAITISDVVAKDGSVEYWKLTGTENLSNATIEDTEWIGDYGRKILGVGKTSFVVGDNKNEDVVINIKPAGSLFMVLYWGTQKYSDVESYELSVSKDVIDCKFDSQGNFSPSWENCNFTKRVNTHEQEGNSGNRYYHYAYILPTSNLKLKYRAYTTDGEYVDLTDEMNVSPKAGEEYLVGLDLDENIYQQPELVNGPSPHAVAAFSNKAKRGNLIHLKDLE